MEFTCVDVVVELGNVSLQVYNKALLECGQTGTGTGSKSDAVRDHAGISDSLIMGIVALALTAKYNFFR
ncbi:hypothetical protein HDU76_003693, partial [Blyttiomyces sp. JEL0837]